MVPECCAFQRYSINNHIMAYQVIVLTVTVPILHLSHCLIILNEEV